MALIELDKQVSYEDLRRFADLPLLPTWTYDKDRLFKTSATEPPKLIGEMMIEGYERTLATMPDFEQTSLTRKQVATALAVHTEKGIRRQVGLMLGAFRMRGRTILMFTFPRSSSMLSTLNCLTPLSLKRVSKSAAHRNLFQPLVSFLKSRMRLGAAGATPCGFSTKWTDVEQIASKPSRYAGTSCNQLRSLMRPFAMTKFLARR